MKFNKKHSYLTFRFIIIIKDVSFLTSFKFKTNRYNTRILYFCGISSKVPKNILVGWHFLCLFLVSEKFERLFEHMKCDNFNATKIFLISYFNKSISKILNRF